MMPPPSTANATRPGKRRNRRHVQQDSPNSVHSVRENYSDSDSDSAFGFGNDWKDS